MHLLMRATIVFGGAKKRAWINAPDSDGVGALILADSVAGAPIVEAAILNDRPQMQEVRMGSGDE